ncbi:hypothetical protein K492DRAFT_195515 [Lichtheimia hyalospora FSU 10163]|nr:hypothetical protein K492DRAFT_195515 [Lichtheimia hyalospora FSU 10163]
MRLHLDNIDTGATTHASAINCICQSPKTPKHIKAQSKRLLHNINQAVLPPNNVYHNNIHQEDGSIISFGDFASNSTRNDVHERSPKRQKTVMMDKNETGVSQEDDTVEKYMDLPQQDGEKENEHLTMDTAQEEPEDATASPSIESWAIDNEDDFWKAYLELLLTDIPHNFRQFGATAHNSMLQGVTSSLCKDSLAYITPYLAVAHLQDLDGMVLAVASVDRLQNNFSECIFECGYNENVRNWINHLAIWPLFTAIAASMNNIKFIPGETLLRAIQGNHSFTEAGCYKADGIVTVEDGFELLLLETSEKYGDDDKPRHGFDHIKGAFGTRMMLRSIFMKYYYGGNDAHDLCVYFAHARGYKLHVWSLSMPTQNGELVLDRIMSLKIPTLVTERDVLLEMLNSFWALKMLLNRTVRTIDKMREEHTCTLERFALGDRTPPPQDLRKLIQKSDCQKPEKRQGTGDLVPNSDPLDDDNIIEPRRSYLIIENIEDDHQ